MKLALTRREGEALIFRVGDVEFTVGIAKTRSHRVRIAIEAPIEVQVVRGELETGPSGHP